jgi:hypothetical protein
MITVSYISLLASIAYRRTTLNLSPNTAHRDNLGYRRATEIQPYHQAENTALLYFYSKTNEMHQFLKFILFCRSTLHVSDGLSVHH